MKSTQRWVYDFRGHQKFLAVASGAGAPWASVVTLTAGTPTIAGASGGGVALALDATNEVQNVCLYFGDILSFNLADIIRMEFLAKISASLASTVTATMGLASARNATPNSVTTNAWFSLQGSNTVYAETDDNTTDTDDKSTGLTLSTTYKRFAIDFSTGGNSRTAPSLSQGGLSDVRFWMGNSNGAMRRVCQSTRFDMSGASAAAVQPFFQIQKTAATDVGTLTVLQMAIDFQLPC